MALLTGNNWSKDNYDVLDNLIESGSNENGSWVKFADGTLVFVGSRVTVTSPEPGTYTEVTILYPMNFATDDYSVQVGATVNTSNPIIAINYEVIQRQNSTSRTNVILRHKSINTNTATTHIRILGVGRWK